VSDFNLNIGTIGTSALHVAYLPDLHHAPPRPAGAMPQPFIEAPAGLFMHVGFNGTSTLGHLEALPGAQQRPARRALSGRWFRTPACHGAGPVCAAPGTAACRAARHRTDRGPAPGPRQFARPGPDLADASGPAGRTRIRGRAAGGFLAAQICAAASVASRKPGDATLAPPWPDISALQTEAERLDNLRGNS